MDSIKEQVHLLYRLSAKLNLYFAICEPKMERVERELKEIEKVVNSL